MTLLRRFLLDEKGATVVEYGLIVAVLSLAIVGGFSLLAGQLQTLLGTDVVEKFNAN
jgi:pilus assembly protein Flp/PilA